MARQTFVDRDREYTVAFDENVPLGRRTSSLLTAVLIDELTGLPIEGASVKAVSTVTGKKRAAGISANTSIGGVCGLIGVPANVFPKLATHTYKAGLQVHAEGYLPRMISGEIGSNPGFPDSFVPLHLGEVYLHRRPVIIRGRVLRTAGSATTGVDGAEVRITGIWRRPPSPSEVAPAQAVNLISISPPLYSSHKASETTVRPVELTEAALDEKYLVSPSMSQGSVLHISSISGLASGDLVVIDPNDPHKREIHQIASIEGAFDPLSPGKVVLKGVLSWAHTESSIVKKVSAAGSGSETSLSEDALAGDVTLLCSSLENLVGASVIEITTATNEKELHWMRHYNVICDANGDYRLPPVSRAAQLIVEARQAGGSAATHVISPSYPAFEQYLEFLLPD